MKNGEFRTENWKKIHFRLKFGANSKLVREDYDAPIINYNFIYISTSEQFLREGHYKIVLFNFFYRIF